ncbi:MAG: PAS domain S-box protein, partial [Crenarchaeota archaeon]|nr:PAS domain S-box protein [Thermoproteota archaeon]
MSNLKASEDSAVIKILLVDDENDFLLVTKQILEMVEDFRVDVASSVDQAFKKLETQEYDVIVSDYEMPNCNGLEFLKMLQEQKNNIPFILFTGRGREDVSITALNLGADGYYNKNGSPETVYGNLKHGIFLVVEKNKIKQSLIEKEKRHENLINQANAVILVHDLAGKIVEVNQHACQSLGYTQEELLRKNIIDLVEPAKDEKGKPLLPKIMPDKPFVFESKMARKDGSSFPVEVTLGLVMVNKKPYVTGFALDLTKYKTAEKEFEQKYSLIEKISGSLNCGLMVISKDYHVIWANSVSKSLGVAGGITCYELFGNLNTVCSNCGIKKIFDGSSCERNEFCRRDFNNKELWFEQIFTPIKDETGKISATLVLLVPINERRQAETAIRLSEEKYRSLFENASDLILIGDLSGKIFSINGAVRKYGYEPEHIVGKNI